MLISSEPSSLFVLAHYILVTKSLCYLFILNDSKVICGIKILVTGIGKLCHFLKFSSH